MKPGRRHLGKVWGAGQAPFRGVPIPQTGAQSRVQQQVLDEDGHQGHGPRVRCLLRIQRSLPIPAVTACKKKGHELRRGDDVSWPRAVQCGDTTLPPKRTSMPLLLAGSVVGLKEVGAGLGKVPVKHLQHPVALNTGPQPQAEELLHLQRDVAW